MSITTCFHQQKPSKRAFTGTYFPHNHAFHHEISLFWLHQRSNPVPASEAVQTDSGCPNAAPVPL